MSVHSSGCCGAFLILPAVSGRTLLAKSGRHHSGPSHMRPQLHYSGTLRTVSPIPGHDSDLISHVSVRSHVAGDFANSVRPFVKAAGPARGGLLFGYARVSKGDEQTNTLQARALRAAGCRRIFEEAASGGR